jgi:hypothetical protein
MIFQANNRWSGDEKEPHLWIYYKTKVLNDIKI